MNSHLQALSGFVLGRDICQSPQPWNSLEHTQALFRHVLHRGISSAAVAKPSSITGLECTSEHSVLAKTPNKPCASTGTACDTDILCLHHFTFLSFTSLQGVSISYRIAVSTENLHIFQYTSIYFLIYMGIAKTSSLFQHICWTVLKLFVCCIYSGDMLVSQLLILSSACTEKLLPWTLEGQLVKHLSILPYSF